MELQYYYYQLGLSLIKYKIQNILELIKVAKLNVLNVYEVYRVPLIFIFIIGSSPNKKNQYQVEVKIVIHHHL